MQALEAEVTYVSEGDSTMATVNVRFYKNPTPIVLTIPRDELPEGLVRGATVRLDLEVVEATVAPGTARVDEQPVLIEHHSNAPSLEVKNTPGGAEHAFAPEDGAPQAAANAPHVDADTAAKTEVSPNAVVDGAADASDQKPL